MLEGRTGHCLCVCPRLSDTISTHGRSDTGREGKTMQGAWLVLTTNLSVATAGFTPLTHPSRLRLLKIYQG